MNKHLLFGTLMLAGLCQVGNAQTRATRTSVAAGNATNPLTWDCFCIPLPGDAIIINHAVILDSDFGYTSGSVTINAAGSLTGDIPTRAFALTGGSFTNNGTMTVGDFYHGGGSFSNSGTLTILNAFASDMTAVTTTTGTFNVNDTLYINTGATLNANGIIYAKTTASAGTLNNYGDFTGDDVFNTGMIGNTSGPGMDIDNLYTSGTVNNNSLIHCSLDLWNSETFTNGNSIVIDRNFWNGDTIAGSATFTNNGTISVAVDLNNSETMDGTGDYCVAGSSTNAGVVNGTLDICDLSGTNFDTNIGTIAGTVTHCSAGSCAIGVAENKMFEHAVYPNPFNTIINFETKINGAYKLNVTNSVGEIIFNLNFTGNKYSLDASALTQGVYFYSLSSEAGVVNGTLVK
ncbi:MAG TPA: T9SS type A sorting domain-containing protein [Flavobacteriales bacterium]|nr:T9SS type A sorting domain-containing protein [Flavobacteriales bacterium]